MRGVGHGAIFTGMAYGGAAQGNFGPGQGRPGRPGGHSGPPRIDPGELRPKRLWYVVAGLVAAVLIGLGILSFVRTLTSAVDSVDTEGRFRGGESLTLHLEDGQERAVFVDLPDDAESRYDCRVTGPSHPSLYQPRSSFEVSSGDRTWRRVLVLLPHGTGEHTVTCEASQTAEFAVGDKPEPSGLINGFLLTVGLPVLGVITCTLIAVLTAVRRGRHRRRLLAERFPRPPYGQPYGGQPPYGQPPHAQPPHGQPPHGQSPYNGQSQQGWGPPTG